MINPPARHSYAITELTLAEGDILYSEGDAADCAYIIDQGEVLLFKTINGKEIDIERRDGISIVGEFSVLTDKPRSGSVKATKPCRAYRISATQIKRLVGQLDPILTACVETSIEFIERLSEFDANRDGTPIINSRLRDAQMLLKQIEFERDIHKALESNQFTLAYQPLVDLKTNEIFGFESLMRWNHPTQGFIPPDKFIRVAESMGVISNLTDFAILKTCETLDAIKDHYQGSNRLYAAVNVSGDDFNRPELVDFISHAVDRYNLQPEQIRLEVTETAIVPDSDIGRTTMLRLRELGCGVAIDDFGTGYSNLAYLKNFPLTALKIDRAFAGEASQNSVTRAIVKMIIGLGHELGARVVAEGLETKADVDALTDLNCDLAQGYYFSKPLPLEDLIDFLAPSFTSDQIVA